jgi:hypothetical protein
MAISVRLIVDDGNLLSQVPDLKEPSLQPHAYLLLDDDAKECRIIPEDELEASYVDNNISRYQLDDISPLDPQVDKQFLIITFSTNAQTSILLGLVDWDAAIRAEQYVKRDGIIYPVDDSGNLMLNVVNTPNLVSIRKKYHSDEQAASETNLKFANLVYEFVQAGFDPVSHLEVRPDPPKSYGSPDED